MFQTLGDYNILDRVGAGKLGDVFRARDTRRGRTVAIQVVSPAIAGDPERRAQFLHDARASAALSHPNIAALYEIGEDQGELFLVSEFVPGEPLKTVIAGRPVNPRRALDLAIQVADALADAHAVGTVHRSLNSETVVVTPKGNAKILDFGLSAWTASGVPENAASTAYLSPEQVLGEQGDSRADLFSLGVILFEMLTGRRPFTGAAAQAVTLQIVQAQAPAPSAANPSLPRELDAIVAKALAKSLDQRVESAALLAAELRTVAAILDARSEAAEAAAPPPSATERSYAGWFILLVLLAALAAAGWWRWGS
jgi:serine/threonine protein kinase